MYETKLYSILKLQNEKCKIHLSEEKARLILNNLDDIKNFVNKEKDKNVVTNGKTD